MAFVTSGHDTTLPSSLPTFENPDSLNYFTTTVHPFDMSLFQIPFRMYQGFKAISKAVRTHAS